MNGYKIRVKVEFVECNDDKQLPEEQDNGDFEMIIDEKDGLSIDKSEHAALMTAYPAIRKAVAEHLGKISKKKPLKCQPKKN